MSITKIALAGNDHADFWQGNNCPASLAARAGCTITATFGPKKTGVRLAVIPITDGGGGSPQSVELAGTGD